MENLENSITYKISAHCEQRYAERIMEKDTKVDINKFIADNRDKIKNDINKMISYGELIYQGKQTKPDGKGNIIKIELKTKKDIFLSHIQKGHRLNPPKIMLWQG